MVQLNKFLYKSSIGEIPTDNQGNPIPALLFANSSNDDRFGDLYLFNNFGISGGDTLTSTSDITTHYTEDNYAIQDHWAIAPRTYTLNGFIGELIYRPASSWTNWLQDKVMNYLEPLSIISPTVSNYVSSAMNIVHKLKQTIKSIQAMLKTLCEISTHGLVFNQIEKPTQWKYIKH